MIFALDGAQRAWREEIRDFLRENLTEALLLEGRTRGYENPGPEQAKFRMKLGERGWFGVGWPEEYGGLGKSVTYQHILINELEYWGAPIPGIEVTSLGPIIIKYGTERNRAEFLPPIARGEMRLALGYSEPNAGTDLASLKTRAILDGDEWVIDGQKIWNSGAHRTTHEWLCVRTDSQAPKHQGISVIIVPIESPGIEIRPLITWGGTRTNETFFTGVRVPRTNLIGEVNKGWQYITGALDLERAATTNAGDLRRAIDDLIDVAQITLPDGRRPADDPVARRLIARLDADVELPILMGLEACSVLESGKIPTVLVTAEKILSSDLRQRIADVATQVLGPFGILTADDPDAPFFGEFEKLYRIAPLMRFGGGTNEVLRDVIAQRGEGLPRNR